MNLTSLSQCVVHFFRDTIWTLDEKTYRVHRRLALYLTRLGTMLVVGINKDNILLRATALAYTTLLSIVPLIAVSLSLFKAFADMEQIVEQLQTFIFRNLTTGTGQEASRYLDLFIERYNSTAIGLVGFVVLILTVVAMLSNIEKTFNHIWQVPKPRSFLRRFPIYWTVITIGPVLLALSLSVTAALQSSNMVNEVLDMSGTKKFLLGKISWIMTFFLFSALYTIMPNTKVKLRSACIGGFVATLFWEVAKYGYTAYAAKVVVYSKIYGSLGIIPLFLLWIYYSWVVVLVGAEVAYADQSLHQRKANQRLD